MVDVAIGDGSKQRFRCDSKMYDVANNAESVKRHSISVHWGYRRYELNSEYTTSRFIVYTCWLLDDSELCYFYTH